MIFQITLMTKAAVQEFKLLRDHSSHQDPRANKFHRRNSKNLFFKIFFRCKTDILRDSIKIAPKGATPIMPDDEIFKPNVDCYYRNETGTDYRGQHNFAEKGVACIPWKMLHPRNKFHPGQSKMKDKDLKENFCRNPGMKR